MEFAFSEYLVVDDLTLLLALIAITIFLLRSLYQPQPLVHPILLGRQSDVARVRLSGESAVYRNYGTGVLGRFPVRPAKDVNVVTDLVKADYDSPQALWSTKITSSRLKSRVADFSAGLVSVAKLVPKESSAFILLNDSIEFIIADLALASLSIKSITVSSSEVLHSCLTLHPNAAIITDANYLSQTFSALRNGRRTIIVIGGMKPASGFGVHNILQWTEIEKAGARAEKMAPVAPNPNDVFTIAYSDSQREGIQFTHENVTAGVTAIRALFPISNPLSSVDTIVSAFSLSTPFGRAIAYTALHEATHFTTLKSTAVFGVSGAPKHDVSDVLSSPVPYPTVLFIKPGHLDSLSSSILEHAQKSSWLFKLAMRHKRAALGIGFLTRESLWDRLVFDSAREKVMGAGAAGLRAVIVSGDVEEPKSLLSARVALSVPIVNAYTNPVSTAPVFASHSLDLQEFPGHAHVGPPGINVEVKLIGVDDKIVEGGGDPMGSLLVEGPPVGRVVGKEDGWVNSGVNAKAQTNGTFKVSSVA